MNNISIKYNVGDKVLYKTKDFFPQTKKGIIKKYVIESPTVGTKNKTIYYINHEGLSFDIIPEENILTKINNTVDKQILDKKKATELVEKANKNLSIDINVIKIIFDGNKTKLYYKIKECGYMYCEIAECHEDDIFSEEKGVEVCVLKATHKAIKEKLRSI